MEIFTPLGRNHIQYELRLVQVFARWGEQGQTARDATANASADFAFGASVPICKEHKEVHS
jgi:hypothetical protein